MEEENIYGYGRVSTQHQNLERQIQALLEFGVKEENIFTDKKVERILIEVIINY